MRVAGQQVHDLIPELESVEPDDRPFASHIPVEDDGLVSGVPIAVGAPDLEPGFLPRSAGDGRLYVVDKLVDYRMGQETTPAGVPFPYVVEEFKVRWQDCAPSEDTW
mgnify:FL=1